MNIYPLNYFLRLPFTRYSPWVSSLLQVDVKCIRKPTIIFQWMGMNALIVYALAACDIFPAALQGFYWGSPENNLVMILNFLMLLV